jgi:hypothetical protein
MFISRYTAAISRDHVALTNCRTGASIAKSAPIPFSSDEQLIENYDAAFNFLGELLRTMEGRARWFRIPTIVVTFPNSRNSNLDSQAVRRLFEELGFVRIQIG